MDRLGINLGSLLLYTLNFTIVLIVLYALAYRPILKALESRRQKIAQGLEDAQAAAEARAKAEEEAARILAEAQANAAQILREADARASQIAEDARRAAEAEAAQIIQDAQAAIEEERNRMLMELRDQVTSLAIAAAQKLLGTALDEKRQRALVDEFFTSVPAEVLTRLQATTVAGESVEVVSALPLTESEQAAIRQTLQAHLPPRAHIQFRIDPAILGGLVIRAGHQVLDGSLAGQLADLQQTWRQS